MPSSRDPDSPRAVEYELSVDGRVVVRDRSDQPVDFGAEVGIDEEIDVGPGLHSVCLRLIDPRFGNRTVDCVDATSSPPDTTTEALRSQRAGVVVTPTGVVVPVVGGRTGNWRVTTPCGATVRLVEGTFVDTVRVVVDAGHGGSEPGAWGGRITEKNLNLEVAELVVERFEELGIAAQITRTFDYRVSHPDACGDRHRTRPRCLHLRPPQRWRHATVIATGNRGLLWGG